MSRRRIGDPISNIFIVLPLRQTLLRLPQCVAGVVLAGIAFALMIRSGVGLGPWEVLADGIHRHIHVAIGTAAILVALLALAVWLPLRQRPGIGTLVTVFLFGVTTNLVLPVVPHPASTVIAYVYLIIAIGLWGFAIALYISAGLGPGPRDGIMTALVRRGHSVRTARTAVEVIVLVAGVILGGKAGPGTVIYALGIGPCIHYSLDVLENSRFRQPQPAHSA